jgi:hypothetical protein
VVLVFWANGGSIVDKLLGGWRATIGCAALLGLSAWFVPRTSSVATVARPLAALPRPAWPAHIRLRPLKSVELGETRVRFARGEREQTASAARFCTTLEKHVDVLARERGHAAAPTRSRRPVTPTISAQCSQQKKVPSFSSPWPTMRMPQFLHVGANAWMAHSKLSKVWVVSPIVTWKALS